MSYNISKQKAEKAAEEVVARFNINQLPVDLHHIASEVGITIAPKPPDIEGTSGMLIKHGNIFAIGYATHIDNLGFQRFTIAHELGHYFIEGHAEALLANDNIHYSEAGFSSNKPYETEADCFAANLLMPRNLFRAAMKKAGHGIDAIINLADTCITSEEATAIRYVECHDDYMALVVSKGGSIQYCVMSPELRDVSGLTWIKKGQALPKNSYTLDFNKNPENVANRERRDGYSCMQDWFYGPHDIEISEDILGLGSYGKTLTILHDIQIEEDE